MVRPYNKGTGGTPRSCGDDAGHSGAAERAAEEWPALMALSLGRAACCFLDLLLVFAASAGARCLGSRFFAGCALDLLALFGVGDALGICHGGVSLLS